MKHAEGPPKPTAAVGRANWPLPTPAALAGGGVGGLRPRLPGAQPRSLVNAGPDRRPPARRDPPVLIWGLDENSSRRPRDEQAFCAEPSRLIGEHTTS